MINKKLHALIYIFVTLSSFGFSVYVGFFAFYLIAIETSPLVISALIGATTLSPIFWGPVAGRLIDKTRYKFSWLLAGQIICGIFALSFGLLQHFNIIITSIVVIGFALSLNLSLIIQHQYLIPLLHKDYEISVANVSRIGGLAVCAAGIFLALFYDKFNPLWFFTISALCYIISALLLLPFIKKEQDIYEPKEFTDDSSPMNVYKNMLNLLTKHWFLALSMCILAFTEASLQINFDVIGFSIGATPFAMIFLLGAISGALDSLSSWFYPKFIKYTKVKIRWYFFLSAFLLIFFLATCAAYLGFDKSSPWFLPILFVCIEFIGVWWGIFSQAQVRATSDENSYGQTMAAFRIPRSIVTFFGMLSIGSALQLDKLWVSLMFSTFLLICLLACLSLQGSKIEKYNSEESD